MKNKLIFILIFVILGFVALQVPVNTLEGSRVRFTLFDLFAPVSGAFLGSVFGIITVFLMQIVNLFVNGIANIDKGSIIRLFPTLFAVWYFASLGKEHYSSSERSESRSYPKNINSLKVSSRPALPAGRQARTILLLVPILSILVFNLHPIGRTVWYYSLFWLIPIVMWRFRERFLLARSLGATFTAHAVGGAIWIWAFNLPAVVWNSLIPVVIMERPIFALGISASYILMNNVLGYLVSKKIIPHSVSIDKGYLIKF